MAAVNSGLPFALQLTENNKHAVLPLGAFRYPADGVLSR
jgi:hypothetical protein